MTDPKAFKTSVVDISVMGSICVLLVFASFLIPDQSKQMKIVFWQTAMLFFFLTSNFVRAHLHEFHWAPPKIEDLQPASLDNC
jgi:hypothetical protein